VNAQHPTGAQLAEALAAVEAALLALLACFAASPPMPWWLHVDERWTLHVTPLRGFPNRWERVTVYHREASDRGPIGQSVAVRLDRHRGPPEGSLAWHVLSPWLRGPAANELVMVLQVAVDDAEAQRKAIAWCGECGTERGGADNPHERCAGCLEALRAVGRDRWGRALREDVLAEGGVS
jgi:hypothetical protein